MLVMVNPRLPSRTFPEFLAYARANPGKLTVS
jgi:tripartite-type tricarboxylate transporter receptor subunit TctC